MPATSKTASRLLYPYTRFSSGEQAEGNSTTRQAKPLVSFLKGHEDWKLADDDFTDEGRSARHARHLGKKGGLARFLTLIKAGVITPGSGLAIENWDRLTRMKLSRSLELAQNILRAGVAIVLVPTGEVFEPTCVDDPMSWTRLVWEFERAYRESERKAEFARDNWEEKRKAIKDRRIVTAWCPFWLDVYQDGKPLGKGRGALDTGKDAEYRENDQAALVRAVFDMADEKNMGAFSIVQELARKSLKFRRTIPTIATVCRLLQNPAVTGTYIPYLARDEKGRRLQAGDPIEGYYPEVISQEQFSRVQVRMARRKKAGRGRRGAAVTNLFSGLCYEMMTATPMYVRGRRGGRRVIVSKAALTGESTRTVEFPLEVFERAVLRTCRELSPALLTPSTPAAEAVARCEKELLALDTSRQ